MISQKRNKHGKVISVYNCGFNEFLRLFSSFAQLQDDSVMTTYSEEGISDICNFVNKRGILRKEE